MKKFILCFFLLVFLLSISYAGNLGVGVVVGEPTGLSLRLWQGKNTALDFGLAWSTIANVLHLSADYVNHNFEVFKINNGSLPFYYGIGARILVSDNTSFGIRLPLGIVYIPKGMPLDFFFEIVPTLELVPGTYFDVDGALGFRYYF
ncbi:MAG TPA: hypothetical protein PL130_05480 [Dictyoglomaceae bacterium]|nr:hypothetical protein [Dictyoglomaceae bacterium]